MSNEDAAAAIVKIKSISKAKDSLKYVFLSHLSRHHNFAELALKTSKSVLKQCAISDINLFAADRFTRTKAVKIL
ncbi:MAG: hypothetical protein LBQ47_05330 [Endomicrobium sp.]|nr:hypothetical protein [Endomicrobium sp.]